MIDRYIANGRLRRGCGCGGAWQPWQPRANWHGGASGMMVANAKSVQVPRLPTGWWLLLPIHLVPSHPSLQALPSTLCPAPSSGSALDGDAERLDPVWLNRLTSTVRPTT